MILQLNRAAAVGTARISRRHYNLEYLVRPRGKPRRDLLPLLDLDAIRFENGKFCKDLIGLLQPGNLLACTHYLGHRE